MRTTRDDLLPKALANLAMRDLTLVESLLLLIQRLEEREDDPDVLEVLYQVDHLGTRMRRNCENLLVMAGEPIDSAHANPVALHDVARAAISEIDQFTRVRVQDLPQLHVQDVAADDLSHLLAELMENALANSTDESDVIVRGRYRDDGGLVVEVADDGIGIPPEKLARINAELREPPLLTDESLRHMGLFVVGLLAHRHGVEVQLQTRPFSGTSGFVHVPAGLVTVRQPSTGTSENGPPVPDSGASPGAPAAAPANGDTTRAAAPARPGDDALPDLPKRDPGRGTPGLRVVEGAADTLPERTPSVSTPEPGGPDGLPELPRRQPFSDPTTATGALPQRVPSGAASATGDDGADEFVTVRGRPTATAAPPDSEDTALRQAERARAELDGYVRGRREYERSTDQEPGTDDAPETHGVGPRDSSGERESGRDTTTETPHVSGTREEDQS